MNTKKNFNLLSTFIGFAFIVILLVFLFKLLSLLLSNLDKLNANIIVAILAGTFTVSGFFITRYLEKKKIVEQQIREQKIPIYQEFIDFILKVFRGTSDNGGQGMSNEEMEQFFWSLNQKAILWLSDSTLKSYSEWKAGISDILNSDEEQVVKSKKMLLAIEKLFLDFRKDIGHKNKNLTSGDILSLIINDWREFAKS